MQEVGRRACPHQWHCSCARTHRDTVQADDVEAKIVLALLGPQLRELMHVLCKDEALNRACLLPDDGVGRGRGVN